MKENENTVKNRSELVFLYDVKNANPNGDPDENRPRIDEETGRNIVTDVRLKRTIRDYLYSFKGQEIFVRTIEYEPSKIQDAKMRAEDFLVDENGKKLDKSNLTLAKIKNKMQENILKKCIDIRLFGATIPVEKSAKEKSSITLTGPVQFRLGTSLHSVEVEYIKGTGAFASEKGKEQKTFREEYILPYSLICFYGIINENAAKETKLTEDDVNLLLEGMWNGTKNLITRSKIGQIPRFLLRVIYKENNFHIGDLDQKIRLLDENGKEVDKDGKSGKEIRSISEVKLDIKELIKILEQYKDRIEKIEYEVNEDVNFVVDGVEVKGSEIENKFKEKITNNVQRLGFEKVFQQQN